MIRVFIPQCGRVVRNAYLIFPIALSMLAGKQQTAIGRTA
jgi:hypothetical protein